MRRVLFTVGVCAALAGLVFAPGCQGDSATPESPESVQLANIEPGTDPAILEDSPTQPGPANKTNLPPFPGEYSGKYSAIHQTSDIETLEGDDFTLEEGDGNVPGDEPGSFVVAPGTDDEIAWAQYVIAGLTPDRPVSIEFTLDTIIVPGGEEDLPLSYWVGFSDYSSYSWEWRGPYHEEQFFILNSEEIRNRYVSQDDEFFFVVVCDPSGVEPTQENPNGLAGVEIISSTTTTASATSSKSASITGYQSTIPHYPADAVIEADSEKTASAGLRQEEFTKVSWTHMGDSASTDNEATRYYVFRQRVDIPRDREYIGFINAPATDYRDSLDNLVSADDPVPGGVYEYSFRAGNPAGMTSFKHAGTRTIPLLPPRNVTATQDAFTEKIVLTWDKAGGATEYHIFKDSRTAAFDTVGDVDTWEDTDKSTGLAHQYWLKSVNPPDLISDFSDVANGSFANNDPQADLAIAPGEEYGEPPHDVHFDATGSSDPDALPPDNGIVSYHWDWTNDGQIDEITENGENYHIYLVYGSYDASVRVYDAFGAFDTASVQLTVNTSPKGSLDVTFSGTAPPPWMYTLDASSCIDPDTGGADALTFQWDFEGDGVWDTPPGPESVREHPYTYDLSLIGTPMPLVQVLDDMGGETIIEGTL